MVQLHEAAAEGRLLVQIGSYNTNLQGGLGLPQDLVDWLAPTLQVSTFLSREPRAPDLVVVGFQELLPLHLGLSGLSKPVINERVSHIKSQIEAHAPNKESYSLIAKVVNVGVALLVYGRDDGVARKVCDVQTQWTGSGPGYMGNKGGVGVRFRVSADDGGVGEVFTFVCAHLTAHEPKLARRIQDWNHIIGSLLFDPLPGSESTAQTTIYDTSHLFFLGDLNFRVSLPKTHALVENLKGPRTNDTLSSEAIREQLKEYDQLLIERRKRNVFIGLKEGEFWKFQCSYKYQLGHVDKYSGKRTPSWTDRVMYSTYSDSPDKPDESNITNLLYTSIPSFTASDHKPVVCLLLLPAPVTQPATAKTPPLLQLPAGYKPKPSPNAVLNRYSGRILDRIIGYIWWLLTFIGAGNTAVGIFNFFLGIGAWSWWKSSATSP